MKKKLIALDIDGTLTNSKKEITPATLAKIMEVQEKGHIIAIASGRPLPGIKRIADTLKLDEYGGYVLAFNGARIVNYKTKEVVYQAAIDPELISKGYEYAVENKVGMVTYEGDTVITGTDIDEYMDMEARLNGMSIKTVDDFIGYVDFPVNKCLMTAETEKAEKVEVELNEQFSANADVFRSEPFFIEIMPKGVNKAASLGMLLDILDMKVEDLIACGDGYNDLSMIQYAGLGVAMSNAQQIVKENADYIAGSNEEDGLVEVFDKFVLQ